jgi:hypothetical protein
MTEDKLGGGVAGAGGITADTHVRGGNGGGENKIYNDKSSSAITREDARGLNITARSTGLSSIGAVVNQALTTQALTKMKENPQTDPKLNLTTTQLSFNPSVKSQNASTSGASLVNPDGRVRPQ